jgi:hypothetical protein
MKNLFNNLTEEEKKSILEQHYQNKENVNEQLGQRIAAGVQGAARRVASRVTDMTQTGVEPNPKLDANARKLYEWNNWISKHIAQFESNIKKIQADVNSDKSTVPQHVEQKNFLLSTITGMESVIGPFIQQNTKTKADETAGKGIYRKDVTNTGGGTQQPAAPVAPAAPSGTAPTA